MVRFGLVAGDIGDVVARAAHLLGVGDRQAARFRPRVDDGDLDREPAVELALFGPDRRHLRTRVALDHGHPAVVNIDSPPRGKEQRGRFRVFRAAVYRGSRWFGQRDQADERFAYQANWNARAEVRPRTASESTLTSEFSISPVVGFERAKTP